MQAVFFEKHGGPDVLKYGEFKDPVVGPNEVLVGVKACALNHLDIWTRLGMPGVTIPLPHILGCDVAGEIEEIGKNVGAKSPRPFKVGQHVIVSPGFLPKNDPLAGTNWDSLSDQFKILGLQVDGGYAEFVKVQAENIIPVSNRLSFEEWAACSVFRRGALSRRNSLFWKTGSDPKKNRWCWSAKASRLTRVAFRSNRPMTWIK